MDSAPCDRLFRFLSTPSARRATFFARLVKFLCGISIHALREEGDLKVTNISGQSYYISIHALREEGDASSAPSSLGIEEFLSTPSARRATFATLSQIP